MRKVLILLLLCLGGLPAMAQRLVNGTSGAISINVNESNDFQVIITGNITSVSLATTSGTSNGKAITVNFTENSVGGFTVAFGGNLTTACSVVTTAGQTTICRFIYNSAANTWADVIGSAGGAAALAGNANAIYASSTCPNPSSGNCFFVNANWKAFFGSNTTIAITSGNLNVTCTNCFTSTAVDGGKLFFATNAGSAVASDNQYLTSISMFTAGTTPTISSVTDVSHAVLSAAPTQTCSATCDVFFGTDDNALWDAVETAVVNSQSCVTVVFPAGITNVTTKKFNTQSPNCGVNAGNVAIQTNINTLTNFGVTFEGQGSASTIFMIPPSFNLSGCNAGNAGNNGCFFGLENVILKGFQFWGGGVSNTGNNNKILIHPGSGASLYDVAVVGFGAADAALTGINFDYGTAYNVKEDGAGRTGCVVSSFAWVYFSYCLDNGANNLNVQPGNTLVDYGSSFGGIGSSGAPLIFCGGTCYLHNESRTYNSPGFPNQFLQVSGSSALVVADGLFDLPASSTQTFLYMPGGNGKVYISNSKGFGGASAQWFLGSAGAQVFDNGGNSFSGPFVPNGAIFNADGHSVKGICTGVGTAASTLGLYGTGPNVTATTCTSTNIGTGTVVTGSRTLQGLIVTATAAGTNASSGVVTVLVDGSASAITCTIGTGTSCVDGTHSVSVTDGQRVSIQFTTQAADTLAGIKAIIGWN